MRLFDRIVRNLNRWLVDLDLERDGLLRKIKEDGRRPEFLARLDWLDRERADHLKCLAKFDALREAHHVALLFSERPKPAQLKAHLPTLAKRKIS